MCVIIDTNTLHNVFKESSLNHADFKPVRDWIIEGKGKIIFGGSKYIEEINGTYLNLFLQLKKAGKAVFIPNDLVDQEERNVSQMIVHPDFDDQHIVGLLRVSKCKLICSLDSRAYPFFQHSMFFSPASKRPKIYSSVANTGLLCDRNIADICKPCVATTNSQRAILQV